MEAPPPGRGLDRLAVLARHLPAGGARLLQPAHGYIATLINGEVTRRNGEDTGARPGRLLRSRRAASELKAA